MLPNTENPFKKEMEISTSHFLSVEDYKEDITTKEQLNSVLSDIICILMSYFHVKKPTWEMVKSILKKSCNYHLVNTGDVVRQRALRLIEYYYTYSYRYENMLNKPMEFHHVVSSLETEVKIIHETRDLHSSMRVIKMDRTRMNMFIENYIRTLL